MTEQVQLEDSFGDLRSRHEVDLEEFGLKLAFVRAISFKSLEQEGSSFLYLIALKENLSNLVDRGLGVTLGVANSDHFCETNSCLGIGWHDVTEDSNEVRAVILLLAVGHNFVELVCFDESLNHAIGAATSGKYFHGELRVVLANSITKRITESEFVFGNPVFNQINFTLGENRAAELK